MKCIEDGIYPLRFEDWHGEKEYQRLLNKFRSECPSCAGKVDYVVEIHHDLRGVACAQCGGTGRVVNCTVEGQKGDHHCVACDGAGTIDRVEGPYSGWLRKYPGLGDLPYPPIVPVPTAYRDLVGSDARRAHRIRLGMGNFVSDENLRNGAKLLIETASRRLGFRESELGYLRFVSEIELAFVEVCAVAWYNKIRPGALLPEQVQTAVALRQQCHKADPDLVVSAPFTAGHSLSAKQMPTIWHDGIEERIVYGEETFAYVSDWAAVIYCLARAAGRFEKDSHPEKAIACWRRVEKLSNAIAGRRGAPSNLQLIEVRAHHSLGRLNDGGHAAAIGHFSVARSLAADLKADSQGAYPSELKLLLDFVECLDSAIDEVKNPEPLWIGERVELLEAIVTLAEQAGHSQTQAWALDKLADLAVYENAAMRERHDARLQTLLASVELPNESNYRFEIARRKCQESIVAHRYLDALVLVDQELARQQSLPTIEEGLLAALWETRASAHAGLWDIKATCEDLRTACRYADSPEWQSDMETSIQALVRLEGDETADERFVRHIRANPVTTDAESSAESREDEWKPRIGHLSYEKLFFGSGESERELADRRSDVEKSREQHELSSDGPGPLHEPDGLSGFLC